MKELEALYRRLAKRGTQPAVLAALSALLESPSDMDRQIDVLGSAHLARWPTSRKRIFWETFPIASQAWIRQCITRAFQHRGDRHALCALLKSDAFLVLREAKQYSPDLAVVWDARGAHSCGLGLAAWKGHVIAGYFYVGWVPEGDESVVRVDYTERIDPPGSSATRRLDWIEGESHLSNWFWAELPCGYGFHDSYVRSFERSEWHRQPLGSTKRIRERLGLPGEHA
jgi:hypothetical protein